MCKVEKCKVASFQEMLDIESVCQFIKFSHGNMAYVMIMLFINIELFMIDNYLSKEFPGQLHESLCKCIGMILA